MNVGRRKCGWTAVVEGSGRATTAAAATAAAAAVREQEYFVRWSTRVCCLQKDKGALFSVLPRVLRSGSRGGWTRACSWRGIRGSDTASASIVRAVYLIGCALSRWSKQICRQRAQSVCWASGLLRPDSSYCWDLSMDVENACDFAIIAGRNAWRMFCASQL